MQGIRYRKLQAVCLAARLLPIIDNFTIGGGGPADPLPPPPPSCAYAVPDMVAGLHFIYNTFSTILYSSSCLKKSYYKCPESILYLTQETQRLHSLC